MTFTLVNDGTDRASWLAARAGEHDGLVKVSATDAARIVTGTAQGWASLRKEKAGIGKSFHGNAATRHGNDREPVIAAWAEKEFGLAPSKALIGRVDRLADVATPDGLSQPFVAGLLDIPELNGLMEGLSYRVDEFGEYKTTVKDWPTWADVPKRYHWQVVWQFVVTGAARCRFVFEPHENGRPVHMVPRVFTIERADVEDDMQTALARVAEWRGGENAVEVPDALVPLEALLSAHARASEFADVANAEVEAIAAEIRAIAAAHQKTTGEAVRFEGTDANVTLSAPGTKKGFDKAAFAAKYPHALARFTTSTPSTPRLTITGRK